MTFAQLNLDPSISKAINACGYTNPTPVQKQSIPKILEGNDVVACAQTGTGKTAAFVLPALHRLSGQKTGNRPRILILTPTRELANQITQAVGKYGKFIRFNMAILVGGMPYRQQLRDLARAVDLVVATPGRLLDHMEKGRLDLSGIEMLVLDEADRMLDMGFIDDVQTIAKATPKNRQTLLFSATVDGKLSQVVKNLLNNPVKIDLSKEKISPAQIKQELYMTDNPQHKARLLQHFLDNENIFKAIIFSATKVGADRLAGQLCDQGYSAAALHGDLKQNVRNRTIEQLRRGKIQFLVATDVAARGLDIADMTHVINYDLPRFCEDYVHRIGRTGRAGKSGIAISFALPNDARHIQRIERYIGNRLQLETIEGLEPSNKPAKDKNKSSKQNNGKPRRFKSNQSKSDRAESRWGKPKHAKSGHAKSDRAESGWGKPKHAKSGHAKSDRAESGWGKPKHAKSGHAKADGAESNWDKPKHPKSDRAASGWGKPKNAKPGKPKKNQKPNKVRYKAKKD